MVFAIKHAPITTILKILVIKKLVNSVIRLVRLVQEFYLLIALLALTKNNMNLQVKAVVFAN